MCLYYLDLSSFQDASWAHTSSVINKTFSFWCCTNCSKLFWDNKSSRSRPIGNKEKVKVLSRWLVWTTTFYTPSGSDHGSSCPKRETTTDVSSNKDIFHSRLQWPSSMQTNEKLPSQRSCQDKSQTIKMPLRDAFKAKVGSNIFSRLRWFWKNGAFSLQIPAWQTIGFCDPTWKSYRLQSVGPWDEDDVWIWNCC